MKNKIKTMDKILIITALVAFLYTGIMIWLFNKYQSIPDTLCTCVYGSLCGEWGIMGWIKTTKERNQDRKWLEKDNRLARKQEKEGNNE